jgi:hypothetical protein
MGSSRDPDLQGGANQMSRSWIDRNGVAPEVALAAFALALIAVAATRLMVAM